MNGLSEIGPAIFGSYIFFLQSFYQTLLALTQTGTKLKKVDYYFPSLNDLTGLENNYSDSKDKFFEGTHGTEGTEANFNVCCLYLYESKR